MGDACPNLGASSKLALGGLYRPCGADGAERNLPPQGRAANSSGVR